MGKILSFLFGKLPDLFDEKGEIHHELPKEKWDSWNKRYFSDPDKNWRNHSGTKAQIKKSQSHR